MIALLLAASLGAPVPAAAQGVSIENRLGAAVPRALVFRDTTGHEVSMGNLLDRGRPLVLYLGYSRCSMLCDVAQSSFASLLPGSGLTLGRDFELATVSIDPHENPADAAEKRRGRLQSLGFADTDPVWPFLLGDEHTIRSLSDSLGFHYRYDAETKQFAHAAAFFVLTPEGRISRVIDGIPASARDLRLAIVEAGEGRVGSTFDQLLLVCWHYDPSTRRYGWAMSAILKGGALLIMLSLGTLLGVLWWRDLRRSARLS